MSSWLSTSSLSLLIFFIRFLLTGNLCNGSRKFPAQRNSNIPVIFPPPLPWLVGSCLFIVPSHSSSVCESESCSVMSDCLWPYGLYSPRNFTGHNTGVRSLSLLQGIFPTQGLNVGLPHCRQILYQLSHRGCMETILVSLFSKNTNPVDLGPHPQGFI